MKMQFSSELEAIPCECISCDGACANTTTSRTNLCDGCGKGQHNVPSEQTSRVSVPTN